MKNSNNQTTILGFRKIIKAFLLVWVGTLLVFAPLILFASSNSNYDNLPTRLLVIDFIIGVLSFAFLF